MIKLELCQNQWMDFYHFFDSVLFLMKDLEYNAIWPVRDVKTHPKNNSSTLCTWVDSCVLST